MMSRSQRNFTVHGRKNNPGPSNPSNSTSPVEDSGADMDMCNSPVSSEGKASEEVSGFSSYPPQPPPLPPHPPPWIMGESGGGVVLPPPDPTAPSQMMMMINPFIPSMSFLPPGPPGAELRSPAIPPVLFPKEMVQVSGATFYPPNPKAPPPQTRDRPPGCRTIFIGGLPEKATEPMLSELFVRCGEIQSLRMSKKNFAHIRYIHQDSIDRALYFSGYRMKVDGRGEKEYSGKMHVDYAQARDDQYEYECAQRALLREQRHRRSPSPALSRTPRIHYSDQEASLLLDKLKAPDTFVSALEVVVSWLEGGDCSKRSSAHFYSMIGAVNAHIRRLLSEKQTQDTELCNAKDSHTEKVQEIMNQFGLIEKTLGLARKQRNWDNFTKAQRKNLDLWLRQAEETRRVQEMDVLNGREEEAMETSDDEEPDHKKLKFDPVPFYQQQIKNLHDELRVLKTAQKPPSGDAETSSEAVSQTAESSAEIKSLQQKLLDATKANETLAIEMEQQKKFLQQSNEAELTVLKQGMKELSEANSKLTQELEQQKKLVTHSEEKGERRKSNPSEGKGETRSKKGLSQSEAKIIAFISSFLLVHPKGASIDYISSYLNQNKMSQMKTSEIEQKLERFPELFK